MTRRKLTWPMTAPSFDPAKPGLGTSFTGHPDERKAIAQYADAHSAGWLSAWDPVTQKEVWRGPVGKKGSGGVLATAGNLVFEGTIGTSFAAYRASDGKQLWELPVQNVPIAAPITYMLDGEQYIAVNAGWGGGLAHVERARITTSCFSDRRASWYSSSAAPPNCLRCHSHRSRCPN